MVSRTQVLLEDDIDGGEAAETFHFAFEGKSYSIDLNTKNAAKFRKVIAPFLEAGQREHPGAGAPRRASSGSDVSPALVRAWATSNGYEVSSRGRIRADLVEAYKAAGN